MNFRTTASLAILIIAIVSGLAYRQHQNRTQIERRYQHAKNELESTASADPHQASADGGSKRPKAGDTGQAKLLTETLDTYEELVRILAQGNANGDQKACQQKLRTHLWELSPKQARLFLIQMVERNKIEGEKGASNFASEIAARSLLSRYRTEGLEICWELFEGGKYLSGNAIAKEVDRCLRAWVDEEPEYAVEWVMAKMPKDATKIGDEMRFEVATQLARIDRKRALATAGDLQLSPDSVAKIAILAHKGEEDRLQALKDVRAYLSSIEDEHVRGQAGWYALSALGSSMNALGFEAASKWADSAGLSPGELRCFASDLGWSESSRDLGKWVNWVVAHSEGSDYKFPVEGIITRWTRLDFNGCAQWIQSQPPHEARDFSTSVFATTVAPYEPESAVEWALTLPMGGLRDRTMHAISDRWPRTTADQIEAAKAFDAKYNIIHDH